MTVILTGDPEDVLQEARRAGKLVHLEDGNLTNEREALFVWHARTLVPETLVFVNPPTKYLDPKELLPRTDRIVAFVNQEIPKAWKSWASKNSIRIQELVTDPEKLILLLMKGSEKLQVPKFEEDAARHLVYSNPGGRYPIQQAIRACKQLELPEPIQYEDVVAVWPFVPAKGRVYAVKLVELLRALGTPKAVSLVSAVPDNEAFSALSGLETACKKYPHRVELIQLMKAGIVDKRWKPKAALMMFAHLCLSEKLAPGWESNSTTNKAKLASPAIERVYQIYDID